RWVPIPPTPPRGRPRSWTAGRATPSPASPSVRRCTCASQSRGAVLVWASGRLSPRSWRADRLPSLPPGITPGYHGSGSRMSALEPGALYANRFEIERQAGRGGMGVVYRARDRYTGAAVALKLLHEGHGGAEGAECFDREARVLAELDHPGVVSH